MLGWLENRLIYQPTPMLAPAPPGLYVEEVRFAASDNTKLFAWYCACPKAIACKATDGDRPVFLYCHGNAGNLADRGILALWYQESLGVDMFMFDYRGYGRSEGSPDELGLYRDGQAAYDYLTRQRGIHPSRIVLFGSSLGGGVALNLGVTVEHRCLILESTFTSLPDVAGRLFPLLPVHWMMNTRYPNEQRIDQYRRPVLLIHGARDSLVPVEHSRRLYNLARQPKRLLEIPYADHNDVILLGKQLYFDAIGDFLRQAFGNGIA